MQEAVEEILALVPGASEAGVQLALLRAADRFCRRSLTWVVHRNLQLDANLGATATAVAGAVPFRVADVRLRGAPIGVVAVHTTNSFPELASRVCVAVLTGSPLRERLTAPPASSAGDSISWLAALRPVQWNSLPAGLYSEHKEVIMNGALSQLFQQPTMPFFDERRAQRYGYSFEAGARAAGIRRGEGLGRWHAAPLGSVRASTGASWGR